MVTRDSLPLIIIGTGLAGYSVAKEFRKLDKERPLILITEDQGHFYSKPHLSTALAQNKTAACLVVNTAEEMCQQLNAEIWTHTKVKELCSLNQTLIASTEQGIKERSYAQLVFACGAEPRPLPLLASLNQHYRINNLHDYHLFREAFAETKKCMIIGSGLVGCEFAHDFASHAHELQIITQDPYPLYGLIPAPMGQALQRILANQGIKWHTHSQVMNANSTPNEIELKLTNEKSLSTPLLLSAIGLLPKISLAEQANIKINQGIAVDEYLQTSLSHHFALGDCAEINGVCRQYVAPILPSARALAQTLIGNPTPVHLPPTPISLKVSSYPILTLLPPINMLGSWEIEEKTGGIKALFLNEQRELLGFSLSGECIRERQTCLQLLGKFYQTGNIFA